MLLVFALLLALGWLYWFWTCSEGVLLLWGGVLLLFWAGVDPKSKSNPELLLLTGAGSGYFFV